MATFDISEAGNAIRVTKDGNVDEVQKGYYQLDDPSTQNILRISREGKTQFSIDTDNDTITVNSAPFVGNSDDLRNAINSFFFKASNGGGIPTPLQGFIDYNDTTGNVVLSSDVWTTIPNDGLGAFTNKTYKPDNITEFMDVSTGAIDTSELDLGDTIIIRNDFTINPNTNNALLEFRYSLGTGGNAYTLNTNLGRLDDGSGKDYRFALKPDLIYMGDSNTKDNPISLQVKLSTDGVLNNAGSVIQLIKREI